MKTNPTEAGKLPPSRLGSAPTYPKEGKIVTTRKPPAGSTQGPGHSPYEMLVYIPHFSTHTITITIAIDADMDGMGDLEDSFPDDPAASVDSDGDGHPDRWNEGHSGSNSTTGLTLEAFPNDVGEWKEETGSASDYRLVRIVLGIAVAAFIVVIGILAVYLRGRDKYYDDHYHAAEYDDLDEA